MSQILPYIFVFLAWTSIITGVFILVLVLLTSRNFQWWQVCWVGIYSLCSHIVVLGIWLVLTLPNQNASLLHVLGLLGTLVLLYTGGVLGMFYTILLSPPVAVDEQNH